MVQQCQLATIYVKSQYKYKLIFLENMELPIEVHWGTIFLENKELPI